MNIAEKARGVPFPCAWAPHPRKPGPVVETCRRGDTPASSIEPSEEPCWDRWCSAVRCGPSRRQRFRQQVHARIAYLRQFGTEPLRDGRAGDFTHHQVHRLLQDQLKGHVVFMHAATPTCASPPPASQTSTTLALSSRSNPIAFQAVSFEPPAAKIGGWASTEPARTRPATADLSEQGSSDRTVRAGRPAGLQDEFGELRKGIMGATPIGRAGTSGRAWVR